MSKVESDSFLRQHHSEEISAGFRWVIGADRPTPQFTSHWPSAVAPASRGVNR